MRRKNVKLTAFLLAAGLLASMTACGGSDLNSAPLEEPTNTTESSSAETTGTSEENGGATTSTETTAASPETTTAERPAASDSAVAEARAALERFLKGLTTGDKDAILANSDYGTYKKLLALYSEMGEVISGTKPQESEAAINEMIDNLIEEYSGTEYEIGEGVSQGEALLKDYNEGVASLRDGLKDYDLTDPDEKKQAQLLEAVLAMMPKLDAVYQFNVKIDGIAEDFVLVRGASGWQVNSIVLTMSHYVAKSKLTAANMAAKTLYNAFMVSLVDMDTADIKISKTDGTHTFSGSDFVGVQKPASAETEEEIMQYLRYLVAQYMPDAQKYGITVTLRGGTVMGIAVEGGKVSGKNAFGTYPKMMTAEDLDSKTWDLAAALAYASGNT